MFLVRKALMEFIPERLSFLPFSKENLVMIFDFRFGLN
ncbi:hypothetical protein FLJC2902T_11840 [Flavobacterium limnosediminis JC2902]|uniref:Uncharacterized protein n=1 Tax=Flavobacterium limnosediminis JC2902 TaxID=1341181 RepID=V6SR33_9FLAO|nr:hypothetical protein FLJC2902T_11840 [Flavobacterium limnosediminis JC2902]